VVVGALSWILTLGFRITKNRCSSSSPHEPSGAPAQEHPQLITTKKVKCTSHREGCRGGCVHAMVVHSSWFRFHETSELPTTSPNTPSGARQELTQLKHPKEQPGKDSRVTWCDRAAALSKPPWPTEKHTPPPRQLEHK
jgi:hypothetical protein